MTKHSATAKGIAKNCNDALIKQIEDLILNGFSKDEVCRLTRLNINTFYSWLKKGEKAFNYVMAQEGNGQKAYEDLNASELQCYRLYHAVTSAVIVYKTKRHNSIHKSGDWKAQRYMLARAYGEEAYPSPNQDKAQVAAILPGVDLTALTPEQKQLIINELSKEENMLPPQEETKALPEAKDTKK